jgi:hypothetical protein
VSRTEGAPRDRRVILIIVGLVVAMLGLSVVSGLVPDIDRALATLPIVVLILVLATAVVLFGVLRR